jgi:hypothetical protein
MNIYVEERQQEKQENLYIMPQFLSLEKLAQIRDTSPISSRNSSKGALIQETYAVFNAVHQGLALSEIRSAILQGSIVPKTAYSTRERIWNAISHRYLSNCPNWVGYSLASATTQGMYSSPYLSLAYLYFSLRDRLVFDFVTGPVWEKWQHQTTVINRGDLLSFLTEKAEESPQIHKWRDSTRIRLASTILAALRDFSLLKGIKKKYIQGVTIESETVYHLLCILISEGKQGRALLEAPDWRLFLWSEAQVVHALANLAQQQWIRFEKGGKTVIIELIRTPELIP